MTINFERTRAIGGGGRRRRRGSHFSPWKTATGRGGRVPEIESQRRDIRRSLRRLPPPPRNFTLTSGAKSLAATPRPLSIDTDAFSSPPSLSCFSYRPFAPLERALPIGEELDLHEPPHGGRGNEAGDATSFPLNSPRVDSCYLAATIRPL